MQRKPRQPLTPFQEKVFYRLAVLAALLLLAWLIFSPGRGLLHLRQQQATLSGLEQEIERLQQDNQDLRHKIDRIQSDAKYLEEVARRDGLLKEHEMVFEFPE